MASSRVFCFLREIHFQVTDFFPEFIPNLRSGFVSGMVLHMLRRFFPVEFGIEIPPAHGDDFESFRKPVFGLEIIKSGEEFSFCQVACRAEDYKSFFQD